MHRRALTFGLVAALALTAAPALISAEAHAPAPHSFGHAFFVLDKNQITALPDGRVMVEYDLNVPAAYIVKKRGGGDEIDTFNAVDLAGMQPENGAGSLSDRNAEKAGKAGDLKAREPSTLKPGSTAPGGRVIDATKQSRIGPMPWLLRPS